MTVWNTITNMKALDISIESFFQAFGSEISNTNCWRLETSIELSTNLRTSNNWCWFAQYMRYTLHRIGIRGGDERRVPGNLTVGVELWREVTNQENLWEHAKQPLIYVGYSPRNDYWSDNMALDCLGSPTWYSDGEIAPPRDNNPYLWTWNGEDNDRWSLRNWFFVLPLCSVGRREDIENEIIVPLRSLLIDNSDRQTAFDGRRAIRTVLTVDA